MKKILITIVALLLTVTVTGCQKENITELNITNTSQVIEKTLKNMEKIEEETLKNVYSLDLTNIEEYVVKQNENGDLYAILKVIDIQKAKENMNDYFEKVKQFNQSYSPERLQILENRVEKQIGNYLIYIVAEDANDIYTEIINNMN